MYHQLIIILLLYLLKLSNLTCIDTDIQVVLFLDSTPNKIEILINYNYFLKKSVRNYDKLKLIKCKRL